jgi:pyrroline-5-carboxylate reductase
MKDVLEEIKSAASDGTVFVSIAAGIGSDFIKRTVGFDCKIVLAMPNTPLLIGKGTVALAKVSPVTDEEYKSIREIFNSCAIDVEEVAQDAINATIPLHSSGPAYAYLFAKAATRYAEHHGIDAQTANRLFSNMLIGAAGMMLDTGKTHDELIKAVCSPGGTTLAGMAEFEKLGFEETVISAFEACYKRANELGQ